jgi:hypothetical protein
MMVGRGVILAPCSSTFDAVKGLLFAWVRMQRTGCEGYVFVLCRGGMREVLMNKKGCHFCCSGGKVDDTVFENGAMPLLSFFFRQNDIVLEKTWCFI